MPTHAVYAFTAISLLGIFSAHWSAVSTTENRNLNYQKQKKKGGKKIKEKGKNPEIPQSKTNKKSIPKQIIVRLPPNFQ